MPELPEVETVARGLRSLAGRQIVYVRLGKTDFIEDPAALSEHLPGSRIQDVRRYGKFLVLDLEPAPYREPPGPFPARAGAGAPRTSGTGPAGQDSRRSLLVHLGMTGQLVASRPEAPVAPHTHAFFGLDDGRELRYTDIRRFGRMLLVAESQREAALSRLGTDPLEITEAEFRERLAGRRARIKALLLDQHVLRGMGNIYADESLWRARIHPARHGASLTAREISRLRRAMRAVLSEAIRLRGSSVSDYVDAAGLPGAYQQRHRVYRREGQGCFRCGGKIRRAVVAGRSSYFCGRCQRARRPGRRRKRRSGQ